MSAIGWFDESTVHSLIGAAREELLTIDQIEQRHRLAAQGMDDVPIIDHMTVFAAGMRSPQRDQRRRAEETFEPVVIQPHAKPMADQARGHRIEHLLEGEPAGRGDGDDRLFVIRGPMCRQRLQGRPFEIQPLAVASIAAPDDLVDKAAISLEGVKIARSARNSASSIARFRWPCGLSIEPFSCAKPRLLRVGAMR